VKLGQVIDDVSFTICSYSFINGQENRLDDGLELMLTQAKQTELDRRLYMRNSKWDVEQVKRYLRCVNCFLALLFIGVHEMYRQPSRGLEVVKMRF
jgi:hypothetical protein